MQLALLVLGALIGIVVALIISTSVARSVRHREEATIEFLASLNAKLTEAAASGQWPLPAHSLPAVHDSIGDLAVWDLRGLEPTALTAGATQLEQHEELLQRAFAAEEDVVRALLTPAGGEKRHGLAALIGEQGEPELGLTFLRPRAIDPRELGWARTFTRLMSESLQIALSKRRSALLAELVDAIDDARDAHHVVQLAIAMLSREMGGQVTALLRYDRGVFRPFALTGQLPANLRTFLDDGFSAGTGLVWEAYRKGEALFLDEYRHHPDAAPELVEAGIRPMAVVPLRPGPGSRLIFVMTGLRPRVWRSHDRELIERFRQILRVVLELRFTEERLDAVVQLERELVFSDPERMPARLLEAAVDMVPGAETGTLLVREEAVFRCAAAHGDAPDELLEREFTYADALRWYGQSEQAFKRGEPRLAVASGTDGLQTVPGGFRVVGMATAAGGPLANLCLPVIDHGEAIAILNVDAQLDPGAFGQDAFEVVRAFQPLIAFVLRDAELRRRLALTATTDALTGLPNRRAFDDQIERALATAERYDTTFALLVMDMAGFKAVNDNYGHQVGDRVLQEVATALATVPRAGDVVFRWGGDEFAALLRNVDRQEAARVGERFAEVVRAVGSVDVALDINVGVALYPDDATTIGELLEAADARMYGAKEGRARRRQLDEGLDGLR